MQVLKKRIIIHEGLNPQAALGAALAFNEAYVENPESGIKTGPYHSRSYLCESTDGPTTLKVYQTKTSIIVCEADLVDEKASDDSEEDKTNEDV